MEDKKLDKKIYTNVQEILINLKNNIYYLTLEEIINMKDNINCLKIEKFNPYEILKMFNYFEIKQIQKSMNDNDLRKSDFVFLMLHTLHNISEYNIFFLLNGLLNMFKIVMNTKNKFLIHKNQKNTINFKEFFYFYSDLQILGIHNLNFIPNLNVKIDIEKDQKLKYKLNFIEYSDINKNLNKIIFKIEKIFYYNKEFFILKKGLKEFIIFDKNFKNYKSFKPILNNKIDLIMMIMLVNKHDLLVIITNQNEVIIYNLKSFKLVFSYILNEKIQEAKLIKNNLNILLFNYQNKIFIFKLKKLIKSEFKLSKDNFDNFLLKFLKPVKINHNSKILIKSFCEIPIYNILVIGFEDKYVKFINYNNHNIKIKNLKLNGIVQETFYNEENKYLYFCFYSKDIEIYSFKSEINSFTKIIIKNNVLYPIIKTFQIQNFWIIVDIFNNCLKFKFNECYFLENFVLQDKIRILNIIKIDNIDCLLVIYKDLKMKLFYSDNITIQTFSQIDNDIIQKLNKYYYKKQKKEEGLFKKKENDMLNLENKDPLYLLPKIVFTYNKNKEIDEIYIGDCFKILSFYFVNGFFNYQYNIGKKWKTLNFKNNLKYLNKYLNSPANFITNFKYISFYNILLIGLNNGFLLSVNKKNMNINTMFYKLVFPVNINNYNEIYNKIVQSIKKIIQYKEKKKIIIIGQTKINIIGNLNIKGFSNFINCDIFYSENDLNYYRIKNAKFINSLELLLIITENDIIWVINIANLKLSCVFFNYNINFEKRPKIKDHNINKFKFLNKYFYNNFNYGNNYKQINKILYKNYIINENYDDKLNEFISNNKSEIIINITLDIIFIDKYNLIIIYDNSFILKFYTILDLSKKIVCKIFEIDFNQFIDNLSMYILKINYYRLINNNYLIFLDNKNSIYIFEITKLLDIIKEIKDYIFIKQVEVMNFDELNDKSIYKSKFNIINIINNEIIADKCKIFKKLQKNISFYLRNRINYSKNLSKYIEKVIVYKNYYNVIKLKMIVVNKFQYLVVYYNNLMLKFFKLTYNTLENHSEIDLISKISNWKFLDIYKNYIDNSVKKTLYFLNKLDFYKNHKVNKKKEFSKDFQLLKLNSKLNKIKNKMIMDEKVKEILKKKQRKNSTFDFHNYSTMKSKEYKASPVNNYIVKKDSIFRSINKVKVRKSKFRIYK